MVQCLQDNVVVQIFDKSYVFLTNYHKNISCEFCSLFENDIAEISKLGEKTYFLTKSSYCKQKLTANEADIHTFGNGGINIVVYKL